MGFKIVRLKLDVQGQEGGKMLDVDGQESEGSWKLDNFHGRHMCIDPNPKHEVLFSWYKNFWFLWHKIYVPGPPLFIVVSVFFIMELGPGVTNINKNFMPLKS